MTNINDMTEEEQIKIIIKNTFVIQYIDKPTELVQLAAVERNGDTIRYIKNPSERVQLAAVKDYGYAIKYIYNPTKQVVMFSLLKLLHDDKIKFVKELLEKYADRNYPEFEIIRQSIEADK